MSDDRFEKRARDILARRVRMTAWTTEDYASALNAIQEGLREVHNEAVEKCADHVGNHSCVSSCCDAQPGGNEAAELAMCVRALRAPTEGSGK